MLKYKSIFLPLLLLFCFTSPLNLQAQSSFGWEFSSTDNTDFGEVEDISTVESENFVCTVARTLRSSDSRNFLLIRTINKSTNAGTFKSIDLGSFSQPVGTFLSTTLSHDGKTVILATSYRDNNAETVMVMTYKFSNSSILFQRSYVFSSGSNGPKFNLTGIQIQKRFNPNGTRQGFTVAVLGSNTNGNRLGMIELNANLSYVSSAATSVLINSIPSSDSNDEMMLVIGEVADISELRVIRYNTNTNSFDFGRKYTRGGNWEHFNPHIVHRLTASGNRNGFFVAFTLADNSNTQVPFVFRTNSAGNIMWSKIIQDDGSIPIGIEEGSTRNCSVVIARTNPVGNEYPHYSLNGANGNLDLPNCFTAQLPSFMANAEFRNGAPDRALITAAVNPTDWAVHGANNTSTASGTIGFACPAIEEFNVATFSINSLSHNISEGSSTPANSTFRFHEPVSRQTSRNNCSSGNKTASNGDEEYGNVSPSEFSVSIFPNPVVGNSFNIRIQSPKTTRYELSVLNSLGQTVHQQSISVQNGENNFQIATASLPAGIYMAAIHSGNEMIYQAKFVNQ